MCPFAASTRPPRRRTNSGARDRSLVRLLFRPAAEESHYYHSASGELSLALLRHLAPRRDAVVVFSPRYTWQEEYLDRFEWANRPVVLRQAVPFVSLLRGVDLVVSSGGTMVREAAYLGVPSYSIFQGRLGAVDRHLASLGRLHLIGSPADFPQLELRRRGREDVLWSNPSLAAEIASIVLSRVPTAERASTPSSLTDGGRTSRSPPDADVRPRDARQERGRESAAWPFAS